MKYIKWFISNTKFFVKVSYDYMKPWTFANVMYYPVAYFKYMIACLDELKQTL